jgi:agmatine deiminase
MRRLPAEWEAQDSILMVFPHKKSDWADDLKSAESVFLRIASSICFKQKLILVCDDKERVKEMFCYHDKISFVEFDTNDTWIRDFGPITIYEEQARKLIDFRFNGWGGKFSADKDDQVTAYLHKNWHFGISPLIHEEMVLEGGSIESDGAGTLLTTTQCLLNPNRNPHMSKEEIASKLKALFGLKRILWLQHGKLLGDDTDAHIDTLARFVDPHTIVYVACDDPQDPHYEELQKMKNELETFRTLDGDPYKLIPLPLPAPIYKENRRLPATYANFLIANHVVLLPTYNDPQDKNMIELFKNLFPTHEIIPIRANRLIEEGGSIHCSTMQVAK